MAKYDYQTTHIRASWRYYFFANHAKMGRRLSPTPFYVAIAEGEKRATIVAQLG